MPLPWALRGLRDGVVTSRWPARPDEYFDGFPAAVTPTIDRTELGQPVERGWHCPTRAITSDDFGVRIDRARCILCGRCVSHRPDAFAWAPGADVAVLQPEQLVVAEPDPAADADDALAQLRASLAHRVRRLRRSVHIRHVDAGSDGAPEWEIQALSNPVYDVHRLGIFFTASPRHADILLVTGVGTAGMSAPLRRTREAMPDPVVVIAAGADALSGGLVGHGYTAGHGVRDLVDVDVWVPGSPPSPFSLLHAILLALGRVEPARGTR